MYKISLLTSSILIGQLFAASMDGLGSFDGGAFDSQAQDISANGLVVVGTDTDAPNFSAFRWSPETGMTNIGNLGGATNATNAFAVNSDGTVIVGMSVSPNGSEAYRWTQAGGMVGLGDLDGSIFFSQAYDVSGDGNTVVGFSFSGNGQEAFRWTQESGIVGLGDLDGGLFRSKAWGVNSDGSVIVGFGTSAAGDEAFRWTQATGMVGLGDLAGGAFKSKAYGVNADGSVIVGDSDSALGEEAFRWTQATGMVGLGDLNGGAFDSQANAVSSDGTVIVGFGHTAAGKEAFRWTQAKGMQSLSEWLAEDGFTLVGWSDTTAKAISDNGEVIVGHGTSANGTEAFIAKSSLGMIGITDFTTSLESIHNVTAQGIDNASILLHGAHGHPGQRRALDEDRVMWVAGDISANNKDHAKDSNQLAEVGVSFRHNENLTYSISTGRVWGNSDLDYKGDINTDGYFITLDTDFKLPIETPLYTTLTMAYGKSDLKIRRGYDNAGNLEYGLGETEQDFLALRGRLQYQTNLLLPYIEYNYIKVKRDGYTETQGAFITTFNKSSESVNDLRIGFDANIKLNESNTLLTTLEGVHRFEKQGNSISGQVIDLSSFSINGRKYDQDWLRGTLGLEHTFDNKSKFSITFNASTKGEDPSFWSGFNYTIGF